VATVQDIDLSAPPSVVDTVTTEQGDRILVHNQSDPVQNGIYDVSKEGRNESSDTVYNSTDIDDPSIAVEQVAGGPDIKHYAFVDNETGDIRYAVKEGETWSVEVVDNQTGSIDIALESDGTPHIIAESGGTQYHYVRDGGTWVSMNGFTSPTLYDPAIDIDSSGGLHVSGAEGGAGNALGYASKLNTTWAQETVDPNAQTQSNDIVLDSVDNVHVAYRDDSTTSGKYAFNDGSWTTEVYSDSNRDDGLNCGIDVDPSDNPHISHYGEYAIWHSYNDGSWNLEKVAGTGETGTDITVQTLTISGEDFATADWTIQYDFIYDGNEIGAASPSDINEEFATAAWSLQFDLVYDGADISVAPETTINDEFAKTSWSVQFVEIFRDIQTSSFDYKDWEINTTTWDIVEPILQITAKDIESKPFNYVGYDLNTTAWTVEGPTIQITAKDIETQSLNQPNYELNSTTWA
jgi:hypothetical protein